MGGRELGVNILFYAKEDVPGHIAEAAEDRAYDAYYRDGIAEGNGVAPARAAQAVDEDGARED